MDMIEILQTMQHYDLLMYPYALCCNPKMAEEVKDKVTNNIKIIPLDHIEYGRAFLVDRKQCEEMLFSLSEVSE